MVPLFVLLLMPDRQPTVWLDPIAVVVYSSAAVALMSAVIAYRSRKNVAIAAGYAVATGVLSVISVLLVLVIVLGLSCGGDSSGAC
jgi:predicted permease